jgi:putative Mg2+ transporter-C (MgtC) family protein
LQFTELVGVELKVLVDVALAMLLGAFIGLEREFKDKPAGLRTHILVAGASALLVALGDIIATQFYHDLGQQVVQADPTRIMEAVIIGVSFVGAGTIIRSRSGERVEGLTTAASLLVAAGVGVCVVLSQIILAVGVTVLVLVTLRGLGYIEQYMASRSESQ